MSDNTRKKFITKGIDIRQALQILSKRGGGGGDPSQPRRASTCGGCEKPPNVAALGQTIDLIGTERDETQQKDVLDDIEALKRKVNEERAQRRNEMEAKLGSLNKTELLQCFFDAQEQRAKAYRLYDQGLEQILDSGNINAYPSVCTEATAAFSVLSDSINNIQSVLREKLKQIPTADLISQLQDKERTKLNLTAALHLERIRLHNQKIESSSDETKDRILELLVDGATSLRSQMSSNIEEINELMDELRCALVDE